MVPTFRRGETFVHNMYVFMPEYFTIKVYQSSLMICTQTHLAKGLKFYSNEGKWTFYEIGTWSKNSDTHWLSILYESNIKVCEQMNVSRNALVFWENGRLIMEIIGEMREGMCIVAIFYEVHQKQLEAIFHSSEDYSALFDSKPLDLSYKYDEDHCELSKKKIAGRKKHMLPCQMCHKEFDRPSLLKRHTRTHTGERPHGCPVCGKGFSTSSSLNTHKRIHSGERPHQCPICEKKFTASSNLYYHRLTHSAEKPHKCDLCGKSFPTPGNLRSHKYSHDGVSPYRCNICARVFSKAANLKNHLNLHNA